MTTNNGTHGTSSTGRYTAANDDDGLDETTLDGSVMTNMTTMTTEEVYNARNNTVEHKHVRANKKKTKTGSTTTTAHPTAFRQYSTVHEEDNDSVSTGFGSLSSMAHLFHPSPPSPTNTKNNHGTTSSKMSTTTAASPTNSTATSTSAYPMLSYGPDDDDDVDSMSDVLKLRGIHNQTDSVLSMPDEEEDDEAKEEYEKLMHTTTEQTAALLPSTSSRQRVQNLQRKFELLTLASKITNTTTADDDSFTGKSHGRGVHSTTKSAPKSQTNTSSMINKVASSILNNDDSQLEESISVTTTSNHNYDYGVGVDNDVESKASCTSDDPMFFDDDDADSSSNSSTIGSLSSAGGDSRRAGSGSNTTEGGSPSQTTTDNSNISNYECGDLTLYRYDNGKDLAHDSRFLGTDYKTRSRPKQRPFWTNKLVCIVSFCFVVVAALSIVIAMQIVSPGGLFFWIQNNDTFSSPSSSSSLDTNSSSTAFDEPDQKEAKEETSIFDEPEQKEKEEEDTSIDKTEPLTSSSTTNTNLRGNTTVHGVTSDTTAATAAAAAAAAAAINTEEVSTSSPTSIITEKPSTTTATITVGDVKSNSSSPVNEPPSTTTATSAAGGFGGLFNNYINHDYFDPLFEFLHDHQISVNDQDQSAASYKAVKWLAAEATNTYVLNGASSSLEMGLPAMDDALIQRYAVLTLDFAINDNLSSALSSSSLYSVPLVESWQFRNANLTTDSITEEEATSAIAEAIRQQSTVAIQHVDECEWTGITCDDNNRVVEIGFGSMSSYGTIPNDIRLFKHLTVLDLSNNNLHGTIPESLYSITQLKELYLYQNQLSGIISDKIGQLQELNRLHLSHNRLSGSIPVTFVSGQTIRPIEYLNLYSNQLTGTIPNNLRFKQAMFADFGRNQFTGPLPDDISLQWVKLKFLYMDHNQFAGSIPYSYPQTGNGRLEALVLNNNQLTGWVSDDWADNYKLLEFNVQNNEILDIGRGTCDQSVFAYGEMIEYKADCDVCECSPFCNHCDANVIGADDKKKSDKPW